jgi:hypothetical protein
VGKSADLILLVIDASFGFEMETFEFLNILQVRPPPTPPHPPSIYTYYNIYCIIYKVIVRGYDCIWNSLSISLSMHTCIMTLSLSISLSMHTCMHYIIEAVCIDVCMSGARVPEDPRSANASRLLQRRQDPQENQKAHEIGRVQTIAPILSLSRSRARSLSHTGIGAVSALHTLLALLVQQYTH